jgi:HEAT repeat protein
LEKEDYLGNLKGVDKVKREQMEGLQSSQFAALITIARANKGNPGLQKAIPYVRKELKRLTSRPKVEDGFMSGYLIVSALENIGGSKAVDDLVKLARRRVRNISQEARQRAISALAETKDKRKIPAIMGALNDMRVIRCEGGVEWIPATAARLLGEMKARRAVQALIRTLRNKEEDVRVAAAKALGDIGDRRALLALRRARTRDTFEVREEAKVAIQAIIRGPAVKVGSSN